MCGEAARLAELHKHWDCGKRRLLVTMQGEERPQATAILKALACDGQVFIE